ncbi:FAD-binding protein [Brenneria tiliae]|uniref:FAD-binding protein n=1 Tax=Brenneria tiliae TaxID=2914984 RepID=UPI002014F930|nr:FAD-binding protein [Brenneria tiliae]MCL2898736.1 FAD-binding protein [Brenneria tiliae]MCL2903327.1 FAD-binding protein [Brenneria tiliae]
MNDDLRYLDTDVLVVGAGGAGMSAAIAAAQQGRRVLLADRSLIGRGGATIMAQMTVAAALGEQGEDSWRHHYADTLAAGRGLCDARLARLLCRQGVSAIRLLDRWGVGWARHDGRLAQVQAPGHDRPRCVYVDYLNTGPALARTLRAQLLLHEAVKRVGDLQITALVRDGDRVVGAVGLHRASGASVLIRARAVVLATGGLTRLYRRSSASLNMCGNGHALALSAGARLQDMEFVQFFPIGHLAPRLVGFDPVMWDPFRYKLGGKLLNGLGDEFVERYGNQSEQEGYTVTRDAATYAIIKEAEAGRGSPAGGAYLSFRHVAAEKLDAAFGPIIGRLAEQGVDLRSMMVEVAPIAHYHMGGVRVDENLHSDVPGLFAAGEVVGGVSGANRLSGNAITEAVAFGLHAGAHAARYADDAADAPDAVRLRALARSALAALRPSGRELAARGVGELTAELRDIMQDDVGPFRTDAGLRRALTRLDALEAELGNELPGTVSPHDARRAGALDLRHMLLAARAVALSALNRTESRGAHQREDFPGLDDAWTLNQTVSWRDGAWRLSRRPVRATTETQA